jgi:hypothetical protein
LVGDVLARRQEGGAVKVIGTAQDAKPWTAVQRVAWQPIRDLRMTA